VRWRVRRCHRRDLDRGHFWLLLSACLLLLRRACWQQYGRADETRVYSYRSACCFDSCARPFYPCDSWVVL
jgi:hypothetical protein